MLLISKIINHQNTDDSYHNNLINSIDLTLIEKANVLHFNNKIFNATYNWDKVCGVFEAQGGEKYITIGNFEMNDKVKYERWS